MYIEFDSKLTEKFNFHCHCWQGHQNYEWNHQKNPKRLIIISHLQFPISLFLSLFECWTAKYLASWCIKFKMLVKNRQKCRTLWSCKNMVLFYKRFISALLWYQHFGMFDRIGAPTCRGQPSSTIYWHPIKVSNIVQPIISTLLKQLFIFSPIFSSSFKHPTIRGRAHIT